MASQWIARPDISLSGTKGEEQLTVRTALMPGRVEGACSHGAGGVQVGTAVYQGGDSKSTRCRGVHQGKEGGF